MKGGDDRGGLHRKQGRDRLALYQRAQEAIEYLMSCNGHTTLTKGEFAQELAARYGRVWLRADGTGNRHLVEQVATLTRDQDQDPMAKGLFDGCVVFYSPSAGGVTLADESGEMLPHHLLHMLSGDLERQQATKTVNRRRITSWRIAAQNAMKDGDFDLGRALSHIENEIDARGFVSDSLVAEFMKLLDRRGLRSAS